MKVLITGATGYIGQRIIHEFENNNEVVIDVCVRTPSNFKLNDKVRRVIKVDFLNEKAVEDASFDESYDVVFYLMHSMSHSKKHDFEDLELQVAQNFINLAKRISIQQVVYFSGIANADKLSKHLRSRSHVANKLKEGNYHLTTLCAGIVVGSGSSSFEIIRDLVEKLPFMITPRWLNTKTHPIGIKDLMYAMRAVMLDKRFYDRQLELGGKDVVTYKEMLLTYAELRGMKRYIWTLPIMTPKLSSYWLYFVTSTNYNLATSLVDSMKIEVQCDNAFFKEIGYEPLTYKEAIRRTMGVVSQEAIISSWKDAYNGPNQIELKTDIPEKGVFKDVKIKAFENFEAVRANVFSIGGKKGWYYGDFLWTLRGLVDKLLGGVGVRRGRTNENEIKEGDALDFWRVAKVNFEEGYLLLYAEMILPGDAWLEFQMYEKEGQRFLKQSAYFFPKGWKGKLYWYLVAPFHLFIFKGMINKIVGENGLKSAPNPQNEMQKENSTVKLK